MLDLDRLVPRATAVIEAAVTRRIVIATAESCTGGLVAALLTSIPGSSAVVDRGFVTYSNEAKAEMLGVASALIAAKGAVSEEVAKAMAAGAIGHSGASLAVSITGIAGPGGGSVEKPVGLVHFGRADEFGEVTHVERRFGDLGRDAVRMAAVEQALALLEDALGIGG